MRSLIVRSVATFLTVAGVSLLPAQTPVAGGNTNPPVGNPPPPPNDPKYPTSNEKDATTDKPRGPEPCRSGGTESCDEDQDCEGKVEPKVGSVDIYCPLPALPNEAYISGAGRLRLYIQKPVENMADPALLEYVSLGTMKVLEQKTDNGFSCTIEQASGEIVDFITPTGAAVGVPTAHEASSRSRIELLDANSNVTNNPTLATKIRQYRSAGGFIDFDKQSGQALRYVSRTGRESDFADGSVEVIRDAQVAGAPIRQIKTAAGLLDVIPDSSRRTYVISAYELNQVGAKIGNFYVLNQGAKPRTSMTISHPVGTQTVVATLVHKSSGAYPDIVQKNTFEYKENDQGGSDWVKTTTANDQSFVQTREVFPDLHTPGLRRVVRRVRDAAGKELHRHEITQRFVAAWQGWINIHDNERITNANGVTNLTRSFTYYETPNQPGFRLPKSQTTSDGKWYRYEYDSQGRMTKRESPWLDGQVPLVEEFSYQPHVPEDTVKPGDQRARTTTKSVSGVVIERTYMAAYTDASGEYTIVEEKAANQSAVYGDAANLRKISRYYAATPTSIASGRLKEEFNMDVVTQAISYESNSMGGYTEVKVGPLDSVKQPVKAITYRETTAYDQGGKTITERKAVWNGSTYVDLEEVRNEYASSGQLIGQISKDLVSGRERLLASYEWQGDRIIKTTSENGSQTETTYDGFGRETATKVIGVAATMSPMASGQYPAIPDMLKSYSGSLGVQEGQVLGWEKRTETRSAGLQTVASVSTYDGRGRVLSNSDEDGYKTTHSYDDQKHLKSTFAPTGAIVSSVSYLDGRIKEVTGNGVIPIYYSYAVSSNGSLIVTERTGSADSLRYLDKVTDMLGRTMEERKPSATGGQVVRSFSFYPGTNRPMTVSDSISNTTRFVYHYDASGRIDRSGDTSRITNILDPSMDSDRIEDKDITIEQDPEGVWLVTSAYAYPQAGAASSTRLLNYRSRSKLAGYASNIISDQISINASGVSRRHVVEEDLVTHLRVERDTISTSNGEAVKVFHGGRLMEAKSPEDSVARRYAYDDLGRITSIKDAEATQAMQITYIQGKNLVQSMTDANGGVSLFSYGLQGQTSAGKIVAKSRANQSTLRSEYDLLGREIRRWGTAVAPMEWIYDQYGQLIALRTFRGAIAGQGDDSTSWPYAQTNYDQTTWAFDQASGVLLEKKDSLGKSVNYEYYPIGTLKKRTWSRGATTEYEYTPWGQVRLMSYSDSTPRVEVVYDRMGRTKFVTQGVAPAVVNTWEYEYDHRNDQGALISLGCSKETASYAVNSAQPFVRSLVYAIDASERLTGWELKNGNTVESSQGYHYDGLDRIHGISGKDIPLLSNRNYAFEYTWKANTGSSRVQTVEGPVHLVQNEWDPHRRFLQEKKNLVGASVISRFQYTPDAISRRDRLDFSGAAFASASALDWGYNARDEVILVDQVGSATNDRGYLYDGIGNRSRSIDGNTNPNGTGGLDYSVNKLNQYTNVTGVANFQYDFDGNMASGPLPVDQGHAASFEWDAENRLTKIIKADGNVVEYSYDFLSRRISKKAGSKIEVMVYDGWNLIAAYGGAALSLQKSYCWGLDVSGSVRGVGGVGGLLAIRHHGQPNIYYPTYDGNGNVSEYLNSSGGIAAHFEYDPSGRTTVDGDIAGLFEIRFSTKRYDVETGLYYYGYRDYDPTIGRWLSRDPLGEDGGENLYGFVWNDSVNALDCLGLSGGGAGHGYTVEGPSKEWSFDLSGKASGGDAFPVTQGSFPVGAGVMVDYKIAVKTLAFTGSETPVCCKKGDRHIRSIVREGKIHAGIGFEAGLTLGLYKVFDWSAIKWQAQVGVRVYGKATFTGGGSFIMDGCKEENRWGVSASGVVAGGINGGVGIWFQTKNLLGKWGEEHFVGAALFGEWGVTGDAYFRCSGDRCEFGAGGNPYATYGWRAGLGIFTLEWSETKNFPGKSFGTKYVPNPLTRLF